MTAFDDTIGPVAGAEGERDALELAETARSRFEATEQAAVGHQLALERIQTCSRQLLIRIHDGPCRPQVLWVLEIGLAMLTAVMAVNREPVPVSDRVDPASFAMSVLRDLASAAAQRELEFAVLEQEAAGMLRQLEQDGFSNLEAYWALNWATASVELGWARSLAEAESNDENGEDA